MKYEVTETQRTPTVAPAADVLEHGEEYIAWLDMPGLAATDIEVSFEHGTLTVRGTPRVDKARGEKALLREFAPVGYERSFRLGAEHFEPDSIEAHYEDGVLKLVLPKSKAMRPRKIVVNG